MSITRKLSLKKLKLPAGSWSADSIAAGNKPNKKHKKMLNLIGFKAVTGFNIYIELSIFIKNGNFSCENEHLSSLPADFF